MTTVEFFDRTPIENAISMLTTSPDKIIFIGDGKKTQKFIKKMNMFVQSKELKTEIAFKSINRNSLSDIVDTLSQIVESEEHCVFDLTGGDDLVLVAMGIVFQKYRDKKIQLQRFNLNNYKVTDCDNDGVVEFEGIPKISVDENIMLHGGTIRYCDNPREGTYAWDYTEDFVSDIFAMWEISANEPGFWNTRIDILGKIDEYYNKSGDLSVNFNLEKLTDRLNHNGIKYVSIRGLLNALAAKGLVSFVITDNDYTITYKNEQVRLCLTTAGTILEHIVTVSLKNATDENNNSFFNDVKMGVHIDWDGTIHDKEEEKIDTKNEIDVLAIRGVTPVFISCKNGRVGDDELYKLETVANKFGSLYAKKILVATYINKSANSLKAFKQRATDMGIYIIENVHSMDAKLIAQKIKALL